MSEPAWTPEMVDILKKRFDAMAFTMSTNLMYDHLQAAMELLEQARRMMKAMTWDINGYCGWCHHFKEHDPRDDCEWAAFLKSTGPAVTETDDE